MTDRELLEMAAKAAGVEYVDGASWGGGAGWDPLANYSDAFQLAAKLQLVVDFFEGEVVAPLSVETFPPGDLSAACLAITRAAAKEGKAMASTV